MNQRPATFKVEIVAEDGKKSLSVSPGFQKFIEKQKAKSLLVIVLPVPEEYTPKKKAPDGNWVCGCGEIRQHAETRCEDCGEENLKRGEPYHKIRQKFGNMREEL